MKVSDFHYELPPERIAQEPLRERTASRLLHLDRHGATWTDRRFVDLPELLAPGDLLVFNDTRVIPARLWARKPSGGRVEILIERIEDESHALVQLRFNRRPAAGLRFVLENGVELIVTARAGEFWRLARPPESPDWMNLLDSLGHVPLPPYIRRPDRALDRERYQTVYARASGAVAAPTAGLHFDRSLLAALDARGIHRARCTLHVGAGTFQPVRVENIEDHRMHPEWLEVGEDLVVAVEAARRRGGRVIAVGTTVVRSLETAAAEDLRPYAGDSRLFIYPGYEFKVVDALITNFHLPGSTLLMLVCAFAGRDFVLSAYRHAVEQRYRFYSYGDAMFIE